VYRLVREMEKQVVTMKVNDASLQTVPLTAAQATDIDELMTAYHSSLNISTDRDPPRDRASIPNLVNIAELSVRRVIAMAKQVRDAVSQSLTVKRIRSRIIILVSRKRKKNGNYFPNKNSSVVIKFWEN